MTYTDNLNKLIAGTDLSADPSMKSTFTMTLTAGALATGAPATCNGGAAGSAVATYFASAEPANDGFRFFGTNQGGMIYYGRYFFHSQLCVRTHYDGN